MVNRRMPSLRWLRRHGAPEQAHQIRLIAGLGNPGARYTHSRHNVGFMVADRFVKAHDMKFLRRRFNAEVAEGEVAGTRVMVIKPQTFMNSSGEAVGKFFSFYKVAPQDLLVIYDDLDLPLGKLRLRPRGSAGGHHGMESIIARIRTTDFPRLRVGIGRPNPDADIDHVLGEFDEDEFRVMNETLQRGAQAVGVWLADGIAKAMNEYNSDVV